MPDQDTYVDAWRGLLRLQEQGLVKSIGVSNFHPHHLQRLKAETGVFLVINQVELHPLFQQRQLHAWNATHQIQTESWSPLAQGGEGVFEQQLIRQLALKYGKTPAQIVIRWHLDSGLVVIPKSVTPPRASEKISMYSISVSTKTNWARSPSWMQANGWDQTRMSHAPRFRPKTNVVSATVSGGNPFFRCTHPPLKIAIK